MARLVSATMSLRACCMSSSRLRRASSVDSRSWTSAALRARATISSDCTRASLRRSRYSSSRSSASALVFSATSIESSIIRWRLSSASAMRGKASLASRIIAPPKTISVQIIRPMPGLTRKLPPPFSAATCMTSPSISGLEEERQQAGDQAVEHAGLGEREAQPLDRGDLVAHLGLARHRLDDLAEDDPDADSGARGAEAAADAERDGLARLGGVAARRGDVGDQCEVHGCSFVTQ